MTKYNRKYTKEVLEEAAVHSKSVADVLRYLEIKVSGSLTTHISKQLKALSVDTSHFDGGRSKNLNRFKEARKQGTEVLRQYEVLERTIPRSGILRRALLESGREEQCVGCGLRNEWQGSHIQLEIDHIDGDTYNNNGFNLRFLCPNCHSQTPTHSMRKSAVLKGASLCACGRIKDSRANKCTACHLDYKS